MKGRGERRYEMRESAYELADDRLAASAAEPDRGARERHPHVLEVVVTAAGMSPEQCNMLVLGELQRLDDSVQVQWFSSGGALAIFPSTAAANGASRASTSTLFRLVAYDEASEAARSVPVAAKPAPTRRGTSASAANRMLSSALGLPKKEGGRRSGGSAKWESDLRGASSTRAKAAAPSTAESVW